MRRYNGTAIIEECNLIGASKTERLERLKHSSRSLSTKLLNSGSLIFIIVNNGVLEPDFIHALGCAFRFAAAHATYGLQSQGIIINDITLIDFKLLLPSILFRRLGKNAFYGTQLMQMTAANMTSTYERTLDYSAYARSSAVCFLSNV